MGRTAVIYSTNEGPSGRPDPDTEADIDAAREGWVLAKCSERYGIGTEITVSGRGSNVLLRYESEQDLHLEAHPNHDSAFVEAAEWILTGEAWDLIDVEYVSCLQGAGGWSHTEMQEIRDAFADRLAVAANEKAERNA